MKRKTITESEFRSLHPFDNMSKQCELLTGLSSKDYWFQVTIECTVDCPRYGYAVLESHERRGTKND